MGIPTAEREIHALRGTKRETKIPNHERPEEIAGQRDPPHIAPIVQHVIVVVERPMEGQISLNGAGGFRKRPRPHPHMPL